MDLFSAQPGESLADKGRRLAEAIDVYETSVARPAMVNLTHVRECLIAMADAFDTSYDDRQRTAPLMTCPQCGHQGYRTGEGQ